MFHVGHVVRLTCGSKCLCVKCPYRERALTPLEQCCEALIPVHALRCVAVRLLLTVLQGLLVFNCAARFACVFVLVCVCQAQTREETVPPM